MGIQKVGERLLPSIAYGDAMGLPTETKSADEIRALYGYIDRLVPPQFNPYYPGEFPAGTTSDDTQLSVVVAEALMEADGFDISSQVAGHLKVYRETPRTLNHKGEWSVRGWGGSTTASMERLAAGISPAKSGEKEGAGNGVLMKLSPLVYWQVARGVDQLQRRREYDQLTTMTHDSNIARACTRLHGEVLHDLLTNPLVEMSAFRARGLEVLAGEPHADPKGRIDRALRFPTASLTQLVGRYAYGQPSGHYGFFVPNTVAMAYDVFAAADGDYQRAVEYAVNLGGDTDSIASIVGSMCNARSAGEFVLPADIETVSELPRLSKLSAEFARLSLKDL
jgi:ADP-ribosylglycohydrolase